MRILLGTRNPAKFLRYQTMLAQLQSLTVLSLQDVAVSDVIVEDGLTAEENARKKARGYARLAGVPTLSIDEALFIEGFSPEEQPGVQVRRYGGKEMTDEALLTRFLEKMKPLAPQQRRGRWTYAICLAFPSGDVFFTEVDIPTIFAGTPHLPLLPGYPLRSLQIDPISGKNLCECTPEEEQHRLHAVYKAVEHLVREALGMPDEGTKPKNGIC